jgi:hypothetical protein
MCFLMCWCGEGREGLILLTEIRNMVQGGEGGLKLLFANLTLVHGPSPDVHSEQHSDQSK